ncbi:hypothetical protein [Amycolatopsis anabasis]|uniref:hypothetical protein n=1 Tax=Amycolatopsis anabasis TaxID=1840409 RepID=UPI00131C37EE|nr:hypothetical protein [Amycolatopsis anabasis]
MLQEVTGHSRVVAVPLKHAPKRIRPPFDTDPGDRSDHRRAGESLEQWRARRHADRVRALQEPLDGVELGAYDRRVIEWLAQWDTAVVGAVASLLYRVREAGERP